MSNEIPDFNESEPCLVAAALKGRYGEDIETQLTLLMVQADHEAQKTGSI